MTINPLFEPSQEEIDALVSRYPLALVISAGAAGLSATPLPLLLERDAYGSATLIGHFARANPQLACIRNNSGTDRISGAARIHFAILVHRPNSGADLEFCDRSFHGSNSTPAFRRRCRYRSECAERSHGKSQAQCVASKRIRRPI
jgi:hypothetical protein